MKSGKTKSNFSLESILFTISRAPFRGPYCMNHAPFALCAFDIGCGLGAYDVA